MTYLTKAREWLENAEPPFNDGGIARKAVLAFAKYLQEEGWYCAVQGCAKYKGHRGECAPEFEDRPHPTPCACGEPERKTDPGGSHSADRCGTFSFGSQPPQGGHEDCSPLPKCSKCCWEVDPKWSGPCAHCGSRKPQGGAEKCEHKDEKGCGLWVGPKWQPAAQRCGGCGIPWREAFPAPKPVEEGAWMHWRSPELEERIDRLLPLLERLANKQ